MSRMRTTAGARTSSDGETRIDAESDGVDGVDDQDLYQLLADRAGVVAAERARALRAFDNDPGARCALSTMAVRIAVQTVEPAAVATERGDERVRDVVADLFAAE